LSLKIERRRARLRKQQPIGRQSCGSKLDKVEGRRGIFVFDTPDIETAKSLVATDPTIVNGEMVAEYHKFYGSAALMMVNEIHKRIEKK